MTKSTITRERLQEIAEDGFLKHGESKELARMALAALDSEPYSEITLRLTRLDVLETILRNELGLPCESPIPDIAEKIYDMKRSRIYSVVPDERPSLNNGIVGFDEGWNACRAAMLQAEPVTTANKLGNSPVIPDGSEDTKRLNWLDAQNKRLNEYYGTSYGWKFDANFQRNAMMLNDSNYPVMTVRQAIDEAIAAAPQEVQGE
ncbi:hypothetical protein ACHBJW_001514 [Klebsiella aerogenes]|uniref:hypothetical protein n=1 Tax=Klebsiella aerogenes TaxID=548 RepID=UPI001D0D92AE|nr:hypothetical protein [Klebsiella aerogenes]